MARYARRGLHRRVGRAVLRVDVEGKSGLDSKLLIVKRRRKNGEARHKVGQCRWVGLFTEVTPVACYRSRLSFPIIYYHDTYGYCESSST